MKLQGEKKMCDYQGYEFGAGLYPDSVCIDGFLYDADDCDDKGNIYLHKNEEKKPCPKCNNPKKKKLLIKGD